MIWEKKGLIFKPENNFGWMNSHAQVPTVLVKEKEELVRVYFSSRPEPTTSLTSFVDLNINDLHQIVYLHPDPILELGVLGTFDEHGIMPSSVIENEGLVYLYYSGWSRGYSVPYNNFTGLAISEDGGKSFRKLFQGPILDRQSFEIYSATSPCVLYENKEWHMWYCSGTNWHEIHGKLEHTYDIKYANSNDGRVWSQNGVTVIAQKNSFEAITKPSVINIDGEYHMWFCHRGSKDFRDGDQGYRIGYANSLDLFKWTRSDEKSGIDVSKSGWESNMIAYPAVVKIQDQIILFYNGNYFGKDGFGYAILSN